MKLKKILSLLFVFVLVVSLTFALASCNKGDEGDTPLGSGSGSGGAVVIDTTGLKYEMKKDGTYKVVGYVKAETEDGEGEEGPFVIEIPAEYEKARVTEIGARAFENCD